jgi:hypothetical protein
MFHFQGSEGKQQVICQRIGEWLCDRGYGEKSKEKEFLLLIFRRRMSTFLSTMVDVVNFG